jgi:uncharacterized protein
MTPLATAAVKPSRYNSLVKLDDGTCYGYNFLYRTIVRIPTHIFSDVVQLLSETSSNSSAKHSSGEASTVSPESLQALCDAYFLIPRDQDELALLKFRYFRNLFANNALSLIVLPTLRCNFSCPYCFEVKNPITMSTEVEQALVGCVETMIKNMRHLSVAWFGGEPLLAKDTILRLSDHFQRLCSAEGVTYRSSLTTNGFFLDRRFQERLASLSIGMVQITMDGDEEAHNKSKRLINGKGSFGQVYENIIAFCEESNNCLLRLRLNCGDENYTGVEKLLGIFPPKVRARVPMYFRWIWPNEATGYQHFARTARGKTPYLGLWHLYRTARALGWLTMNPLSLMFDGYCEADRMNHFQIGPDGNVFVCTHTFRASEAIGSILDRTGLIRFDAMNGYAQWYAANPFHDPKCTECVLLPVCLGGCRKNRVNGRPYCTDVAERLELYTQDLIEEKLSWMNAAAK